MDLRGSGRGIDAGDEDSLVERLGMAELGDALRGVFPCRRDQTDHGLAAVDGTDQFGLPPGAGRNASARVDVEEDVTSQARLLFDQPLHHSARRPGVAAGVADKHLVHAFMLTAYGIGVLRTELLDVAATSRG